jgi:CspA family cold shock protein
MCLTILELALYARPPAEENRSRRDLVPVGAAILFVVSMAKGTVKWFNEKKGFGFIVDPEVATDIFVHFSVIQADGFKTLNEGETVEYELYQDEKGAKARNVVRVPA